jgi:hypothetical protein
VLEQQLEPVAGRHVVLGIRVVVRLLVQLGRLFDRLVRRLFDWLIVRRVVDLLVGSLELLVVRHLQLVLGVVVRLVQLLRLVLVVRFFVGLVERD